MPLVGRHATTTRPAPDGDYRWMELHGVSSEEHKQEGQSLPAEMTDLPPLCGRTVGSSPASTRTSCAAGGRQLEDGRTEPVRLIGAVVNQASRANASHRNRSQIADYP
jgi:hypothetical protein